MLTGMQARRPRTSLKALIRTSRGQRAGPGANGRGHPRPGGSRGQAPGAAESSRVQSSREERMQQSGPYSLLTLQVDDQMTDHAT